MPFLSKYYNTQEFVEDPIQSFVYTHYSNINPDVSMIHFASLKEYHAVGTNSYLTNSINQYNYTYYKTLIKESYLATPSGDFYPYVGFSLTLDPEVITTIRSNKNLF